MADKAPRNLSEILIQRGMVDPEILREAEQEARNSGTMLERDLVEKDIVSGDNMTLALSDYLGIPPIILTRFTPDTDLIDTLPKDVLQKCRAMPVAKVGKNLTVALGDPFNIIAMDELHSATGLNITPLVASEKDVVESLKKALANDAASLDMEDIMRSPEDMMELGSIDEENNASLEEMMESADDQPVIRMVNMILIDGVRSRANDIHIEPQEDFIRLRLRVDGVLVERPNLPKGLQSAVISRIKILSDLDIGEQRLPQDGRFRINTLGKAIDVRVSVLPTIHGGRVVMRLLDKNALFPSLAALDLDEVAYKGFSYAIEQPHGIILVTGPTGSGKTTTLYSCLQELNKIDVNIVTCEDPVEYQIPGIIQVKITPAAGCTFAAALRSILRQDPDIVLIGEIRDLDTAEISIKAALTGHLVLSTLHANDASSTVTRLLDMGIEPFLLASSIILTQAQRLFRKLCPVCKKPKDLDLDALALHKIDPDFFKGATIYGATGCPKCQGLGYSGRGAVMEVLPIGDEIRGTIMQQEPADVIRDKAVENGMVPLSTGSLLKVKDGTTSLEAALRIISSR